MAANLIHIHERAGGVCGAGGHEALTTTELGFRVRRGIEVDDQLRTAVGLVQDWPGRVPRVLADRHADADPAHIPELGRFVASGEIASLVEYRVVREFALVVNPPHLTMRADGGGVVEVSPRIDEAHNGHAAAGCGGDLL